MADMTSKERVVAAFRGEEVDHVPCVPGFSVKNPRLAGNYGYYFPFDGSQLSVAKYCAEKLCTDFMVSAPINQFYPDKDVTSKIWYDKGILHKVWDTPKGILSASVKYSKSWPCGYDIPLFHDFIAHHTKHWVENRQDLECLKYILRPLAREEDINRVKFDFFESKLIADEYGFPLISHIGMGLTGALQLFSPDRLCILTMDDPDLIDDYLEIEHKVNIKHIEIMADLGVDIVRRNGFYETADFYSPDMLKKFLFERLNREAEIASQAGVVTGYTVHTGIVPILDYLADLKFDCLMHIDTAFRNIDLKKTAQKLKGRKSVLTGPSNTFHMFSEDPEDVKMCIRGVFEAFGKEGLLIAPCPAVHSIMPWENTLAMIEEWNLLKK